MVVGLVSGIRVQWSGLTLGYGYSVRVNVRVRVYWLGLLSGYGHGGWVSVRDMGIVVGVTVRVWVWVYGYVYVVSDMGADRWVRVCCQ